MDDTVTLLYLFTRIDALKTFLAVSAILVSVVVLFLIVIISTSIDRADWWVLCWRWAKLGIGYCVFAAFTNLVIPSQKDLAVIVGGKLAVDAATAVAPEVAEIATKIRKLVHGKLDEEINKLQKEGE